MEELGQHPDAALLDLEGLGVLGVVDEVAVQVPIDHPPRLRLHPGGDEGRQVALRNALDGELLVDQAHRGDRRHRVLRDRVVGGTLGNPGPGSCLIQTIGCVVHVVLLIVPGGPNPLRSPGVDPDHSSSVDMAASAYS